MVIIKKEKVEAIKSSRSSCKSQKCKAKGKSSKKVGEQGGVAGAEEIVDITGSDLPLAGIPRRSRNFQLKMGRRGVTPQHKTHISKENYLVILSSNVEYRAG